MITLLFLFILALGAAVVVLWPLIQGTLAPWSVSVPEGEDEVRRQEQIAALEALRDLALDYRLGNIELEDYRALAVPLQQRARGGAVAASSRSTTQGLEDLDTLLEAAILARRQVKSVPARPNGRGAPAVRYCSQCGASVHPDDRFCSACGAPLSREPSEPASPAPEPERLVAEAPEPSAQASLEAETSEVAPHLDTPALERTGEPQARRLPRRWLAVAGVLVAALWVGLIARFYISARTQQETQIPVASLPGVPIQDLALTPAGLLVAEPGGLRLLTDGEDGWQLLGVEADIRSLAPLDDARTSWLAVGPQGLWRSTDGGQTWTELSPEPAGLALVAVATSSGEPGQVFGASLDGIWRSVDGGATWEPMGNTLPGRARDLALGPMGILFLGTERGVFRSEDGGQSWLNMNGAAGGALVSLDVQAIAYDRDGNMLFAGTPAGLSFMKIGAVGGWGVRTLRAVVTGLAMEETEPPTLWVGTRSGQIFRSTDRGVSWQP